MEMERFLENHADGKEVFCEEAEKLIQKMENDGATEDEVIQALYDFNGDGSCFAKNYVFRYKGWTNKVPEDSCKEGRDGEGNWIEYDGFEVNAPNEDEAWDIFLHSAGRFGCPSEEDYRCELKAI